MIAPVAEIGATMLMSPTVRPWYNASSPTTLATPAATP
jgi:hypothetical protein